MIESPNALGGVASSHSDGQGPRQIRALCVRIVLSFVILLSICSFNSFYEQDGIAKAAQILSLAKEPTLLNYHLLPDYYRKDLFSSFYLVATVFYKLTPFSVVQALNLLSVICGGLFLTIVPAFLRRVFGFNEWLTWLALLLTPIYTIIFSYGNETAVAAVCAAACALCLTFDTLGAGIGAGILFGMAVFARSDYLFLGPALSLLTIVRTEGVIQWRQSAVRLSRFGVTSFLFAVVYLLVVLREFPKTSLFVGHSDMKLMAAFIVYGGGIANIIFALIGVTLCVAKRRWAFMLLLAPILVQAVFYARMLESPKYIAPAFLISVIYSVIGMQFVLKRSRLLFSAIVIVFCFISVSPYGVFGPAKSALWYVPSAAGPIPAGGYIGFYIKVKEGFFQKRYDFCLEQMSEAMKLIDNESTPTDLGGEVLNQVPRLWATRLKRWDVPPSDISFIDTCFTKDEAHRAKLMLKCSYLYLWKQDQQSPDLVPKLSAYLKAGRVKARTSEVDPFPNVVQIGLSVPENTDLQLGQRIAFMNDFWNGEDGIRRDVFIKDYAGVSWISRKRFDENRGVLPKPLHVDDHWVMFDQNISGALYYSIRFPMAYSRIKKRLAAQ